MKVKKIVSLAFATVFVLTFATAAMAEPVTEPQDSGARHTLSEIVNPDSQWEKVTSSSGFIEGLNFDRDGNLWMVDVTSGRIMKVVDGNPVVVGEPYKMPNGAKFHKDGRLFVADRLGELYTLDPVTGKRTIITSMYDQETLRGLNDLVFDNKGGLYITEPYGSNALQVNGRVFYLPPGSNKLQLLYKNIAYPNGIAISPDNKVIYIAEFAQNRIVAAPAAGISGNEVPHVFAHFEGGFGPDGLTVDAEGNVYVARFQAGEVTVLAPNGFQYGSIRLPASASTFVSNLVLHDGYMYVTDSLKNDVWRIKINKNAATPYGLQ